MGVEALTLLPKLATCTVLSDWLCQITPFIQSPQVAAALLNLWPHYLRLVTNWQWLIQPWVQSYTCVNWHLIQAQMHIKKAGFTCRFQSLNFVDSKEEGLASLLISMKKPPPSWLIVLLHLTLLQFLLSWLHLKCSPCCKNSCLAILCLCCQDKKGW